MVANRESGGDRVRGVRVYGGGHPRMKGLYALKPWYTRRFAGIVDFAVLHGISPDVFTASGMAAAAVAGVFVALGWWPLALMFLALRLAGANLDGAVARTRNVARPWGFVLNKIGDRASDVVVFAGLAVWAARQSGPELRWLSWPVFWVLAAALAATLPTFRVAHRRSSRCDPPQRRPARQDRTLPRRRRSDRAAGHDPVRLSCDPRGVRNHRRGPAGVGAS